MTFAFYNTENLFDVEDDPLTNDEEFTPSGRAGWTEERLDRKLEGIARAIRSMNDGRGPDVCGLCEVENLAVLTRLVEEFLPQGIYGIVHTESHDARGIDVAILYRRSLMTLKGFVPHPVDLGSERPTRDILEATFERNGRTFTVCVNHWPSRLGGASQSEPRRVAAAQTLAHVIDSLTALDPAADIVALGDFNDEPTDHSIAEVLDAPPYSDTRPFSHRLINTAAPVAEIDTIGSYFYKEDWETIDQIMLSPGALDSHGLVLVETSETVFAPNFLRDAKADPDARPPYRTFKYAGYYIGGVSDHFPVQLRIGWRDN